MNKPLRPLYALMMGLLMLSGRATAPARSPEGTEPRGTAIASVLKPGDVVPEFGFTNQDGRRGTSAKLRPKAVLMTFIFTRCTAMEFCPRMSLKFQETRTALNASAWKNAVELVSVTLDPEHDTPEALRVYSKSFDARPGSWTFAACTPEVLATLKKQFGVRASTAANGSIEHNLVTVLIDSQGRLQKAWEGNRWTTDDILAALQGAFGGGDARNRSGN